MAGDSLGGVAPGGARVDSGAAPWRHARGVRTGALTAAGFGGLAVPGRSADLQLRCTNCGMILRPATIRHEQALVFASCCPRCDGELTEAPGGRGADRLRAEPSIYLG